MRSKEIAQLLKVHRHLKASVICSSQWLNDLQPMSILQLDYFICFKSFSLAKLQSIHRSLDLGIEFDDFWKVYQYCVAEPYSFMYLNTRSEEIRRNFNQRIAN